jgi:glutamyl-tRNA reductase
VTITPGVQVDGGDREPGRRPELVVQAAHDRAERARREVLAKHARRLASLSEHHRAAVDDVTRALVDRLVSDPLRRAHQLADGTDGTPGLWPLLCELFAANEPTGDTAR